MSVETDLAITGKVAQFGRGVLNDVSGKLLAQFVENLERDVLSGMRPTRGSWSRPPVAPREPDSEPLADFTTNGSKPEAVTGDPPDRRSRGGAGRPPCGERPVGREAAAPGGVGPRPAPCCSVVLRGRSVGPAEAQLLGSNPCSISTVPCWASTRGSRAVATAWCGSRRAARPRHSRAASSAPRRRIRSRSGSRRWPIELERLLAEVKPAAVSVERVLFQANARTAMSVGQASGLALATAARMGIPVTQYSPNEVKLAVTGDGAADKAQVQAMVDPAAPTRRAAASTRRRRRARARALSPVARAVERRGGVARRRRWRRRVRARRRSCGRARRAPRMIGAT